MNKIFFINEDVLKSETILNDNVGSEFIRPAIEASQDIYLQQIIGSELMDRLSNLISTDDISKDEFKHYKYLLDDHITNYLKYKVLAEITIPLAYKYRTGGVVQTNGDHTSNSTLKDATLVQNHYELRATFYSDRLSKYLMTNNDIFPEYLSTRDTADMKANPDSYKTNILL